MYITKGTPHSQVVHINHAYSIAALRSKLTTLESQLQGHEVYRGCGQGAKAGWCHAAILEEVDRVLGHAMALLIKDQHNKETT